MAADYWPTREQEHCQDREAPAGAQIPSGLTSSPPAGFASIERHQLTCLANRSASRGCCSHTRSVTYILSPECCMNRLELIWHASDSTIWDTLESLATVLQRSQQACLMSHCCAAYL